MEKNLSSRHSRRHSTGNFYLEPNGYEDVLSRYLCAPFPSCHDNCKHSGFDHLTEPKSSSPSQRSSPSHRSSPTQRSSPSHRSSPTQRSSPSQRSSPNQRSNITHVESTTSVHGSKKHFTPIPRSPTKHVKSTNNPFLKHQVKHQPIESKRQDIKSKSKIKSKHEETDPFYIPTTRHTRRFSDVVLPTNGFEDVLHSLDVGGFTKSVKKNDKKIDSRKDSKSVKSTVKTPGNGIITKKVHTLTTHNVSTKPRVDYGSRKSKPGNPVGEVVQEKSNHKSTKPGFDQDTKKSKAPNQVGEVVEEKTDISQRAAENGQTLKAHDDSATSGADQLNPLRVSEVVHKEGEKSQKVLANAQYVRQVPSKSKEDETPRSESKKNASVAPSGVKKTEKATRVGKLAEEHEELSSKKFKQGKTIDTQSKSSGPKKLRFVEGKVLDETQNSQEDSKSLRRLSSDGVLHAPESKSVNVVLKPCEKEANKRDVRLNNVIEEAASKLIQTRKSKVKALVGAFEMISTNGL